MSKYLKITHTPTMYRFSTYCLMAIFVVAWRFLFIFSQRNLADE